MFKKNKLSSAMAVVLATGVSMTMLTGLTGCKDGGGTSITSGSTTQISNPKGTVVGNVQDTNGNALSGVTVYLAGNKTTTDAGGNYRFNNVGVINAAGADEDTFSSSLSVTIAAPAGYLSATVTVRPEAQVDGTNDNEVRQNTTTIFVDGFIAQAGTAVLPALSTTVTGVLRDNNTGEAISGVIVSLDMSQVDPNINQAGTQNQIGTTYQTLTYASVATDANGNFSIPLVPDDSELRFVITGYNINTVEANASGMGVDTSNEGGVFVGDLTVTQVISEDDKAPYIVDVSGIQNLADNPGLFNDDIDGTTGITISFSETMDSLLVDDTSSTINNSVVVRDVSTGAYLTTTTAIAADAKSITLTTTAIPEGAHVEIFLLRADFQDAAGNIIVDGTALANDPVDFDGVFDSSANGGADDFIILHVKRFKEINLNATAVTIAQLATDSTAPTGSNDEDTIQAVSVTFNDVDDAGNGFQQLNSADDDDTASGNDAAERISDLASELKGSPISVSADIARITFDHTNASSYLLRILNTDGDNTTGAVSSGNTFARTATLETGSAEADINLIGGTVGDAFGNDGNYYRINNLTSSAGTFELLINNTLPGESVEITPLDDLGFAGTNTSLALTDNVEVTVALQNSYNQGDDIYQFSAFDFGDGGELVGLDTPPVGVANLHVTPQLLDNLDNNGVDVTLAQSGQGVDVGVAWGPADNDLSAELFDLNGSNSTTNASITTDANGPYDATAFAAASGTWNRRIGVAMTEDVTATGTSPTFENAAAGTIVPNTITAPAWTAHNDVSTQDNSGAPGTNVVDLMDFNTTDVFGLANLDNDLRINFASAIQDNQGNVTSANANAKVRINDAMPPMITSAFYSAGGLPVTQVVSTNGHYIQVTFNEDIELDRSTDTVNIRFMTLGLTNALLGSSLASATAAATTGNVLIILPEDNSTGTASSWVDDTSAVNLDGFGTVDRSLVFNLAEYAESVYTFTSLSTTGDLVHTEMTYSAINDVNGNNWSSNNAGLLPPYFALIDGVGNFEGSGPTTAPTAANVVNNVVWTFAHPLNVETTCGLAAGDTTLDAAQIASCFTFTAGSGVQGVLAGDAGTTGSLSSDGKTLTVTFNFTGGTAPTTGSTVTISGSAGSVLGEFDATDSATIATTTFL